MNAKIMFQLAIVTLCLGYLHVDANSSFFKSPLRSDALGSLKKNYFLNKPLKITPFSEAPPFTLDTLDKGFVRYPSDVLPANVSIGFHAFTKNSGFLEGLWHNVPMLGAFIKSSPSSVNYIFLSFDQNATSSVIFMQSQLINAMNYMKLKENEKRDFLNRCYFSLTPVYEMGNWIVTLLSDWACQGHGCGYDQITFRSKSWNIDFKVLMRLDARYDWAWNHSWKNQLQPVIYGQDVCHLKSDQYAVYNQSVVLVNDNESACTIAEKATILEHSGALGVIVYSAPGMPVKEIDCHGNECSVAINIPVTSIPYSDELINTVRTARSSTVAAELKTSPSPNFFFSIDSFGRLVEFGWALYPSLEFLGWQMQWLVYQQNLFQRISTLNDYVVPVFNSTTMTGHNGTGNVSVTLNDVRDYDELYLDASLSCEGSSDEDCPPWDHVASLYVCCGDVLGNTEIGRWITPFRRRIGRWLTNISPLLPLFHGDTRTSKCTFVMKSDAWWAKPWVPSLSLRFRSTSSASPKPFHVEPLFEGGTFDNSYNSKYKPQVFVPPTNAKLVKIVAVISGHGSDDNQCGEFCVTSHHFTLNSHFKHAMSFDDAGSPLGCTKLVTKGAVPNEHGTWLYGRGGWCDGMQVQPWVIDITSEVQLGQANKVIYRGLFKGRDPNPKQNPGLIRMTSFLVFYR